MTVLGYAAAAIFFILTPFTVAATVKCFVDDTIQFSRLRTALSVILSVLFFLTLFIDYISKGFTTIILATPFLGLQSIIFSAGRGKRIIYYIECPFVFCLTFNVITIAAFSISSAIISVLYNLNLQTFMIDDFKYYAFFTMCLFPVLLLALYLLFLRRNEMLILHKADYVIVFIYHLFTAYIAYDSWINSTAYESIYKFMAIKALMLLMIIVLPVTVIKLRQSAYYSLLSTRNEQFLEAELTASNAYRQSQEDTRAFRHDMNNNLAIVSALMKKGQFSEAENYINDLRGNLSSFSPRIVTGDDMLDALLASKLSSFEQKDIRFTLSGVIDGGLNWKPIDVCAVFANLIDNASEACEKVTDAERFIDISIKKTELQRIIVIRNSTAAKVDCSSLNGNMRFTSKADSSRHGYGMQNIRKTLEKNGAMMQISCTDTVFTTTLMMTK